MTAPLLYRTWVAASQILLPFFGISQVNKLRRAGLPALRAHEKLGHASEPRPDAPLIWFHAASVGESLSVLALITRMGAALPRAEFLITSGTATSATLIAQRLPPRTRHQFAPLDAPGPLKRFLKHWRPDAAIFVESELWPQMLRRTHESGAAMALVNARLSQKSIKSWRKRPALAHYMLEVFDLILTQNDAMAEAMVTLGAPAPRVARAINLKSMAGPLPVDENALFDMRATILHRPVWVASSTHAGEEEIVLEAHKELLKSHPDLCLILAPRHPERADAIAKQTLDLQLPMTRRTEGDRPTASVYIADTLGELGLWYALTDIVFLGGSLKPIGGHNPYEVAHTGAATLTGPHVTNFAETFGAMTEMGAAQTVETAEELAKAVNHFLSDSNALQTAKTAATDFAAQQMDLLDGIADRLIKALKLGGK